MCLERGEINKGRMTDRIPKLVSSSLFLSIAEAKEEFLRCGI